MKKVRTAKRHDVVQINTKELVLSTSEQFPCRVKLNFRKLAFTAFLTTMLDAQQHRGCVETKPASLLIVSLRKALNGIP